MTVETIRENMVELHHSDDFSEEKVVKKTPFHNLPAQPTPLVGRERQVEEACALMRVPDVRLLTLSGTGGVGKTRLALQIASKLVETFEDGTYFISLATITDPSLLPGTIANTLGLKQAASAQPLMEIIKDYLRDKHLLLVLDNFEQVVEATPLVRDILSAAPDLKILVTSRALLHAYGEHEFVVPPLELPNLKRLPPVERLAQNESVALFVQRARTVSPDFNLNSENAAAVAEICARLDGLPLAIELAAARVKLFTPQAMLTRLTGAVGNTTLRLLTGGARDLPARQQTLRNTIDWSYEGLNAEEKVFFARLSVFVGGCTLEAAESILGANTEDDRFPAYDTIMILDGLTSLLDKSLLRKSEDASGKPRFGMLETIREYALERLAESGKMGTLQQRHAEYYLGLAEEAEQELKGSRQVEWLDLLEGEHDNLRAALRWALETGATEVALRLSGSLWRFWQMHSYLSEGLRWLERSLAASAELAQVNGNKVSQNLKKVRAKALHGAGLLAYYQGYYRRSADFLEESLALCRELDDKRGIILALQHLGLGLLYQGDPARATKLFEEVLSLRRELQDTRGIGLTLNDLGNAARGQGNFRRATELLQESLKLFQELGYKEGTAIALSSQGHLSYRQGDYDQAGKQLSESFVLFQELGNKASMAKVLEGIAAVAARHGYPQEAARLWGAAEALIALTGAITDPEMQPRFEQAVSSAGKELGEVGFTVAQAEGRVLTSEQVLALVEKAVYPVEGTPGLALPEEKAAEEEEQGDFPAGLTLREVEVLRLIVSGASNAAIAEKLIISIHTVKRHVAHILGKLDAATRTEAAIRARELGIG